jgi:hypothetical protein
MKIEFTDERIKEYYEGGIHELNDGEPIEVSEAKGQEMLKKIHFLDDKEVHVFQKVKEEAPADDASAEDTAAASDQPGDFLETAEQLAKNKREDLEKMAREAGLDGDSYTNKTELAQAIVAARSADAGKTTDESEG